MVLFLTLVAALAAIHAHGALRILPRLGFRAALRLFLVGSLATAAALALAGRGHLLVARPVLLTAGALAALVAWGGLIRLVSFESRRGETVWRTVCLGFAALVFLNSRSVAGTAFFLMLGTMMWHWQRELKTRSRFTLGLIALVVGIMLVIHTGRPWAPGALPPSQESLAAFARAMLIAASNYALLGSFVLLRAWAQDPSLGIRRVAHRLALSHILVGVIPVVLVGALWTTTTILGVLNERAIVGARAIAAQGRWYHALLNGAIERPSMGAERLASLPASIDSLADIQVWYRGAGEFTRIAGHAPISTNRLDAWIAGLDTLPSSGITAMRDSLYVGAAARGPRGTAAVLLVPVTVALADLPDSVSRAHLELLRAGFSSRVGPVAFQNTDDDSSGPSFPPAVTSGMSAEESAEATRALNSMGLGEDSARAQGARRALKALGMPDSMVDANGTLQLGKHKHRARTNQRNVRLSGASNSVLLAGHSMADGLKWTAHGWERTQFMLTAGAEPRQVLLGLFRDLRTNELGIIPVIIVGLFVILALLVLAWNLLMVSGMGRSITRAVHALDAAAARLRAGDLAHRIVIAGDDDLWHVAEALNTATDGLQRARDAEKIQQRMENELDVARRIQARLLPAGAPLVRGLEVGGYYDPAREVGGDYYDHIALDDHRVMLVIADVSGKSVPAALIMAGFRAALVSQDLGASDPPVLAERLNGFLNDSLDPGKFVTAFIAIVDGDSGTVSYVNAGHNPPLLLRANGKHEQLEDGGTILGIMAASRYARGETTLDTGDVLLLYTDGVPEGTAPDSELWGDGRLLAALQAHGAEPCDTLVRSIANLVRDFEADRGPADDVTLIAVRRTP